LRSQKTGLGISDFTITKLGDNNNVYIISFIFQSSSKRLFTMRLPSFDELALDIKKMATSPPDPVMLRTCTQAPIFTNIIGGFFWLGCPIDGREFLDKEYQLCTHDAFMLLDQLKANGESWILYNKRRPRYDLINTPFDFEHPQWKNRVVAPSFELDTDPIWKSENGIMYK